MAYVCVLWKWHDIFSHPLRPLVRIDMPNLIPIWWRISLIYCCRMHLMERSRQSWAPVQKVNVHAMSQPNELRPKCAQSMHTAKILHVRQCNGAVGHCSVDWILCAYFHPEWSITDNFLLGFRRRRRPAAPTTIVSARHDHSKNFRLNTIRSFSLARAPFSASANAVGELDPTLAGLCAVLISENASRKLFAVAGRKFPA